MTNTQRRKGNLAKHKLSTASSRRHHLYYHGSGLNTIWGGHAGLGYGPKVGKRNTTISARP